MKRGQVTLFAIMGLVLVLFFLYVTSYINDSNEAKISEAKKDYILYDYNDGIVRDNVQNCIENSEREAIVLLGSNAGFLSLNPVVKYAELNSPYSYDGAVVMMDSSSTYFLSEEDLANKICKKVSVDVQSCIDKVQFEKDGFTIETININDESLNLPLFCEAILRPDSVVVTTNYPMRFSKEELSFDISRFSVEIPSSLKSVHESAQRITNQARDDDYLENHTYDISDHCREFSAFSIDISNRIVTLRDKNSLNSAIPNFIYKFAILDYNVTGSC